MDCTFFFFIKKLMLKVILQMEKSNVKLILTLMKVVLKVGLRKIMKVLFLKIVKRREQLGLMMVLIVRMNI